MSEKNPRDPTGGLGPVELGGQRAFLPGFYTCCADVPPRATSWCRWADRRGALLKTLRLYTSACLQ